MEAYIVARGLPEFYRCEARNLTQDEWWATGKKELALGLFCLIYGTVAIVRHMDFKFYQYNQSLYCLCLIVLLQRDLFKMVAYKILFYITCCDIIGLLPNSVISGILFMQGAVYCNYPNFIYFWGCVCLGWWGGVCMAGLVLGITRLVDLFSPQLHETLFAGKRLLFSFVLIIGYQMYFFFFTKPILFNSPAKTWFFDPQIYPDGSMIWAYSCWALTFNNTGTVSATLCLYILFSIGFIYKYKNNSAVSKHSTQMFLQTAIVNMNNFTLALIYVTMSYIQVTETVSFIGLIFWQLTSSGGLIIFLGINRTVRGRILELVGLDKVFRSSSIGAVTMSSQRASSTNPI